MPVRRVPIPPSRINSEYLHGPLYHYDKITDEEAMQLGLLSLPGPGPGAVSKAYGYTARRLKCGRLNVTAEARVAIQRDPSMALFMETLLRPLDFGDAATEPMALGIAIGGGGRAR